VNATLSLQHYISEQIAVFCAVCCIDQVNETKIWKFWYRNECSV